MSPIRILGVIGGSGLYELESFSRVREEQIKTPFGSTSSPVLIGDLGDIRVVFISRHGRRHQLTPGEVPYAANIYALKELGVQWVLAFSAVGSLREEVHPGHVVLPDQLIDRTRGGRRSSFFGEGVVGHIPFAEPFCPSLRSLLFDTVRESGGKVHNGGTLVVMEGPAFSTRAESMMYRAWGAHIIGMTSLPEAKLAREAELCYCTVALCTDYDCWRDDGEAVNVNAVLHVMKQNGTLARQIIRRMAYSLTHHTPNPCLCNHATDHAIMTYNITGADEDRLRLIIGRHLPIVGK